MNKKLRYALATVVWLTALTALLARWWYANPDWFPHFPPSVWKTIDSLYGADNVELEEDVELIVVVVVALVCVGSIHFFACAAWRRMRNGYHR